MLATSSLTSSGFPERKRASKSKVRTGCITCKSRRVKCDETQPSCLRCLRYSGVCVGYSTFRRHPTSELMSPGQNSLSRLLPRILPERRFRNDLEQFYFNSFRDEVAPGLTGVYSSSIWDRIMLQASHHEQFVHDSIVALSALSKSLRDCPTAAKHHLVAIKYYDGAVKSMQKNLSCSRQDLRKALLSCLLVYCFESLEGNQDLAISHAKGGLALLYSSIPGLKDGTGLIETSIEADIYSAFYRIDLQVFLMGKPEQVRSYRDNRTEKDRDVLYLPSRFDSVTEADSYWLVVMRRAGHFVYQAIATATNSPPVSEEIASSDVPASDFKTSPSSLTAITSISPQLRQEQRLTIDEMCRWEHAFEPLRLSFDPVTRSMTVQRRIAFLSIQILVGSILFTDECACDKFLPHYREIVQQSRKFVRQESTRKFPITYDLGIIPSLYVLTKTCRDPATRRGAIAVLRDTPRREGIWDSLLVAEVSEWLMLEEEKGLEGDFIPEHARIKITKSVADPQAKVIRLTWMRSKSKDDVTPMELNSTIPWNGGIQANLSVAK